MLASTGGEKYSESSSPLSPLTSRLALRVLLLAGTGRKSLLLAFMLVTTFLSMFICNTATCAMIVPILAVVLEQLYTDKALTREKAVFYLAVAYCANIGGTGTVTAEETNLILMVGWRTPKGSLSLILLFSGDPGHFPH